MRTYTTAQKTKFILATAGILLVFVCIAGEVLARIVYVSKPEAPPPYNTAVVDEQIGWRCKPGYHFQGEIKDADGRARQVEYNSDPKGFRYYGTQDSLSPKVWFIGDSFTQAVEVSDGEAFYAQAAKLFPMNMYASGMSGWGNLQECLWMERYLPEIQPDIIILQVCSNDYIDNSEALEREAIYKVDKRRPYLRSDGSIYYSYDTLSLHKRLLQVSRLYKALLSSKEEIIAPLANNDNAEYHMANEKHNYVPYAHALEITRLIFQKIRREAGPDVAIYMIDTSNLSPFHEDWNQICRESGIVMIGSIPHRLNEARSKGNILSGDGWHWNPEGHRIVGEEIAAFLHQQYPLL